MPYASWFLNDLLLLFPLSPAQWHGVSDSHSGHSPDPNITDHRTASTWGVPVVQSLLILSSIYLGCSGRTVTANIIKDLTSGKGSIADLECFYVYFWKVL